MKLDEPGLRNDIMIKTFSLVEIGERAGSGMNKIFKGWEWAGYDMPTYEVGYGPDRTMLTLPLSDSSSVSSSDSSTGRDAGRINRTNRAKARPSAQGRHRDVPGGPQPGGALDES